MAIGYDASTISAASTGDLVFTLTGGNVKGLAVIVAQTGGSSMEVAGVDVGGTTLSREALSPVFAAGASEPGGIDAYFLGAGLSTGDQDITVSVNGGNTKIACAVTFTGATNTQIIDSSGISTASGRTNDTQNWVVLDTDTDTIPFYGIFHGTGNPTNLSTNSLSATAETVGSHDFGVQVAKWLVSSTEGGSSASLSSNSTMACFVDDVGTEEFAHFAMAVGETTGGGGGGGGDLAKWPSLPMMGYG